MECTNRQDLASETPRTVPAECTPIVIRDDAGKPVASSKDIAAHFGKAHKNVLADIKALMEQEPSCGLNFQPTSETVAMPRGGTREDPAYLMDRDGFTLLAMGFTGAKALKFKLAYIAAFNAMEAELRGNPRPALVIDAATKNVIGGIVENCVVAAIREQLVQIVPPMVERALLEGGSVVSTDYRPVIAVLKEKKVPAKRRRAFSQRCSARLRRFALASDRPPRLSRETGRYLFHVDTIRAWLDQEGQAMISDHMASLAGQGVLSFRRKD